MYDTTATSTAGDPVSSGVSIILTLVFLVFIVLMLVATWKIYKKAGQPGWASIVPIYNIYVLMKIVGRPGWWTILYFIPFVNIIISLIVAIDLAKVFGRSSLFGVVLLWLISPIGYLMLGFGGSTYSGTSGGGSNGEPIAEPQATVASPAPVQPVPPIAADPNAGPTPGSTITPPTQQQ